MRLKGEKIPYRGKEYPIKHKYNKFRFVCDKCGRCCCDIDIMLNPYDIIRICNRLKITSVRFLKDYASITLGADSRVPIVLLNTRPRCVFNKKICTIYEDRPTNCRGYPVGRITMTDKDTGEEEAGYIVNDNCSAIQTKKRQTIEEWLRKEKADEYFNISTRWNRFITKLIQKGFPKNNEMFNFLFIKACYDFDNNLYNKLMAAKGISQFKTAEDKFNFILDNAEPLILNIASKVNFDKVREMLEKNKDK